MSVEKAHEFVVLGGNLAGLQTVHCLLRQTIPNLKSLNKQQPFHVTLVTPNTHVFFKPGSPRALIQPKLLSEDKIWRPLSEALKQYPADSVTLIQGVATSLNPNERTVSINNPKTEASPATSGERKIPYDSVILATGTTSSPLWTIQEDQSLTSKAYKSVQEALPKAKSVLVAGGGAVGVETAGELSVAYPTAKLTLVSGGPRLLQRTSPSTGAKAQDYLQSKFGVNVIHNVTVTGTERESESAAEHSPIKVSLSNGETHTVDVYIDATGGVPNSQYLPTSWLDDTKRVITRDDFFRVRGASGEKAENVYVVGDLVAGSSNALLDLDAMIPTVCSAVGVDVAAKFNAPPPTRSWLGGGSGKLLVEKPFKPFKDSMVVAIGTDGGVGQVFGWPLPSWFVKMAKAKTFLIGLMDGIMTGDKFKP